MGATYKDAAIRLTDGSHCKMKKKIIFLAGGTFIYIVLLSVGTTPPAFNRTTNSGTENMGLTGANIRWGTLAAGQTALPASFMSANIVSTSNLFIVCGM